MHRYNCWSARMLCVLLQESRIMVESAPVYDALGKSGAAGFRAPAQSLPNTPVSGLCHPAVAPNSSAVHSCLRWDDCQ